MHETKAWECWFCFGKTVSSWHRSNTLLENATTSRTFRDEDEYLKLQPGWSAELCLGLNIHADVLYQDPNSDEIQCKPSSLCSILFTCKEHMSGSSQQAHVLLIISVQRFSLCQTRSRRKEKTVPVVLISVKAVDVCLCRQGATFLTDQFSIHFSRSCDENTAVHYPRSLKLYVHPTFSPLYFFVFFNDIPAFGRVMSWLQQRR